MKFAVCVVLSALAVYAIASDASESESESGLALAPAGTIVSVTALERQDMMNFLIRFNASDASNPSAQENFPMAQVDLCQSMNVALLGNAYTMVCVDFVTNIVVKVDPHTGAWTKLLDLPNAPQPYTATVYNDQSAGTSTLFAELSGIFQNKWVAYDLNTGKQLALSTVTQNWQLAMTQFVPEGKF